MSGFVALVNTDGAAVDRTLLSEMTSSLRFRGPDAQNVWCDGCAGLGHAMLRVSLDTPDETQPCSLDQRVWIVGDARIDARSELIARLAGRAKSSECALARCSDVELILHAYAQWGEACPASLIGDFAFAIWDSAQGRLLCARDHFGVKPLYYATVANVLVVSNTLECVRQHGAVSDDLNEHAIGDFLLFGYNREPTTTTFTDVARVPPAHALTWNRVARTAGLRRFWTLPIDQSIRYKRAHEYVEHFTDLLQTAVRDRLRTDRAGALMSGGLDSTAVTAFAHRILCATGQPFDLVAYTHFYEALIPDEEGTFAGLVAEKLKIPIEYSPSDKYFLCQWQLDPKTVPPEPNGDALAALDQDELKGLATTRRVALAGYGSDQLMHPGASDYLMSLVAEGRWVRAAGDFGRATLALRRVPFLSVRGATRRLRGQPINTNPYPSWISPDFAARIGLRDRWRTVTAPRTSGHRRRPRAYELLTDAYWPFRFETFDSGVTRLPVDVRYPFFDKRVAEYLLGIPAIPWFERKYLLREAMRDVLPESVRTRPKPQLPDPVHRFSGDRPIVLDPRLLAYARVESLHLDERGAINVNAAPSDAICLNEWLRFRAARRTSPTVS